MSNREKTTSFFAGCDTIPIRWRVFFSISKFRNLNIKLFVKFNHPVKMWQCEWKKRAKINWLVLLTKTTLLGSLHNFWNVLGVNHNSIIIWTPLKIVDVHLINCNSRLRCAIRLIAAECFVCCLFSLVEADSLQLASFFSFFSLLVFFPRWWACYYAECFNISKHDSKHFDLIWI